MVVWVYSSEIEFVESGTYHVKVRGQRGQLLRSYQ